MQYLFPTIEHIDDIRPALEGFPEFILADRGDVTFIQYGIIEKRAFSFLEDPLLGAIRRELRGIAFCNRTGKILSRPFHKFFNLNENEEVQARNIDWSQPHTAHNKLDGSMVRPIVVDGEFRLATKMSLIGVAYTATEFMLQDRNLTEGLRAAYEDGITPIMEWTGPNNQIVVQYKEPRLTLLKMRDNKTGAYVEDTYGLPIPKVEDHKEWSPQASEVEANIDRIAGKTGEEGVVVWFGSGHAVKVKNYWYHNVHKLISEIGVRDVRRHIVLLILKEQYDDILQFLGPDKAKIVEDFHDLFWRGVIGTTKRLEYMQYAIQEEIGTDMKVFAQTIAPTIADETDRKILFQSMKGSPVRDEVMKHLEKSTVRDSYWSSTQSWLLNEPQEAEKEVLT